jgi:2-oxoglutarate ferredoxin oxidoreductase subunit alpha
VYVVEQNRDAQMFSLLRMDLDAELLLKLRSVARLDGLPIDARSVTDEIAAMEEK